MIAWAFQLQLPEDPILALHGPLGAGKTTFSKGIASRFGTPISEIQSPTFTTLQIYPGPVYHFDLYRMKNTTEFLLQGFDEYLQGGITLIEWPDRISPLLPSRTLHFHFEHAGNRRRIRYLPWN